MDRTKRQDEVAALEAERVGYERRGLTDRIEQVDAQLKRLRGDQPGRQTRPRGAGKETR